MMRWVVGVPVLGVSPRGTKGLCREGVSGTESTNRHLELGEKYTEDAPQQTHLFTEMQGVI